MLNNQELIAHLDTTNIHRGFIVIACLTIVLVIYLFASSLLENVLGYSITFLIQTILVLWISLFSFGLLYYVFFLQNITKPVAILNKEGIWVMHFGFIPWHEVAAIKPYKIGNVPIESIAIYVHDTKFLWKQASVHGKIAIFWSKLLGTPHISLPKTTLPNYVILSRAHTFMEQHKQKE